MTRRIEVTPEAPMNECCLAWIVWAQVHGIERGRELADVEAAALHHRAWRVVQTLASYPERDAEADRQAKQRRDARWSA